MVFEYCPTCGEKLEKKEIGDEGLVPFCVSCNKVLFSFSYPCVLCLIIDGNDNIVLAKGLTPEGKVSANYGVVAGFVKEGETIEDAAKREIKEEIGIEVFDANFIKSYRHDQNTLILGFVCKAKNTKLTVSPKEIYSAEWFPILEAVNLLRQGGTSRKLLTDYLQSINV